MKITLALCTILMLLTGCSSKQPDLTGIFNTLNQSVAGNTTAINDLKKEVETMPAPQMQYISKSASGYHLNGSLEGCTFVGGVMKHCALSGTLLPL